MNNDADTRADKTQNLCLFIIMILCGAILVLTYKTYKLESTNWGSLEHYDSMYEERQGHVSMNHNGDITGYEGKDGIEYSFKVPIPADYFYNN